MASVAMISFGASMFDEMISETKLAVIPTIAIIDTKERTRTRTKVFAKGAAPYSGIGIFRRCLELKVVKQVLSLRW